MGSLSKVTLPGEEGLGAVAPLPWVCGQSDGRVRVACFFLSRQRENEPISFLQSLDYRAVEQSARVPEGLSGRGVSMISPSLRLCVWQNVGPGKVLRSIGRVCPVQLVLRRWPACLARLALPLDKCPAPDIPATGCVSLCARRTSGSNWRLFLLSSPAVLDCACNTRVSAQWLLSQDSLRAFLGCVSSALAALFEAPDLWGWGRSLLQPPIIESIACILKAGPLLAPHSQKMWGLFLQREGGAAQKHL